MSEPPFQPLNKGAIDKKEQLSRTAKDLIDKEWKIIDQLQRLAEDPRYGSQRAFYYQTLASHVRTLSMLLKLHGQQDQSQDLAKILSQINTEAQKLAKRLKQK
jgi:predicted S18 family serine protease